MKVYLVIGDADMGKSSVLRHLVAFSNGNGKSIRTKTLATTHGAIEIGFYGYQALQEHGTLPREFIDLVNDQFKKDLPENLILALRLNATKKTSKVQACPDADAYIRAFIKEGWTIFQSFVLDGSGKATYPKHWNAQSILSRPAQGKAVPTNQMAANIRNPLGWI